MFHFYQHLEEWHMFYQGSPPEASAPPNDCNSSNCSICYIGFRRRLAKVFLILNIPLFLLEVETSDRCTCLGDNNFASVAILNSYITYFYLWLTSASLIHAFCPKLQQGKSDWSNHVGFKLTWGESLLIGTVSQVSDLAKDLMGFFYLL